MDINNRAQLKGKFMVAIVPDLRQDLCTFAGVVWEGD